MTQWPIPQTGVLATHLQISSNVAECAAFYQDVLGATLLMPGPPAILQLFNTWLQIAEPGGPTDDKPDVDAIPADPVRMSSALNLRVADIHQVYDLWKQGGADFLTEPKLHASEWRCYFRDPGGHLVEVGQATRLPTGD